MKQLLRYTLTLVALFVATANLSAQNPNYQGGTWYSLYDATEYKNTNKTFSVFSPTTGSLSFQWKKTGWAVAYPIYNLTVSESSNGSNYTQNYKLESGAGKKQDSYVSVTATISENITHLKFEQSGSLSRFYKDIKLPLAKHIRLNNGTSFGTNSLNVTDNNLATSVGVRSTNAYTIPLRSFFTQSGKITITSNNSEFHFSDGSTTKTFTLPTNNFCASASATGSYGNNWQNISNFQEKIYFTPSVNIKGTRSTTIIISDGTHEAQIILSAPVIPTYFFKAEAISSPAEGGTATATFANGQSTYSIIAPDYATGSLSTTVTFTAAPKTADGYVFEGWKTDPASTTFHKQGADQTTFTETIASTALNPNGLTSQLTYYAIFSKKFTATITGRDYANKLVGESFKADYKFVNTQTSTPTAVETDPFHFKIEHNFTGNDTRNGSTRPDEVIDYNPTTNMITALNEGTATITFYQKNTDSHQPVTQSFTVTVIKYTPTFTWNSANTPYYYGTSIPNIFSTTNSDATSPVTFESNNAAFAHVENNTLYIANARETATITVTQAENYKWYGKTENYPISPVNGSKHVPFKIDTEAKYNLFKNSISTKGTVSWSGDKVRFAQENVGFNWDDSYYDIHFEGVPDVLMFNYNVDGGATGLEWFVQESSNGTDWSAKTWSSTSNNGSATITLQSSTRYLRFCYSGNLNGYISDINVTERFQFEATPTTLNFGTNGINHGKQEETVTFQHANAGRVTKAEITGVDAQYFGVNPADITSTGRDLYGTERLQVTFDNQGTNRGKTPYNAVLTIYDNAEHSIDIPLTGIRDGKSTPNFIWNPNAMPYYFNTTIANIAYSTNKDAKCPLTYTSSNNTIAEVIGGDLHIYAIGQEVTITVTQPGNADYMPATETFTFTPCERPNLEVPFRVSQNLHEKSMQLGTKCQWVDDAQIQMADPLGDGFMWGDERKRLLITFAGVPDKLYFEFHSKSSTLPPTPENAIDAWLVEESPNGVDWTIAWRTSDVSTDWVASGEIDLKPNTQYIRFSYKGNFAGYIRNIIISSLEGNNFLRAEEGTYLSRGAKYGTQAVVDPFGIACRVSRYTVDNTNIYTRFQFVDNMQYLWETHDTKELFTDDKTADNTANRWQIPNTSGKFTIQSGNNLGNMGQYLTINNNVLTLTSESSQATVWHMESPAEHDIVLKNYMDAAAAKAAKKDFGTDVNTLDKVRSYLEKQEFEVTEIAVPTVELSEQSGEYRDGINGTFDVYDNTITDLKPGFYRLTVRALYRISESEYAQVAKANNLESVVAYVYANNVKYPIQSVYDSHNGNSYDTSDEHFNQHYYPAQLRPSVEKAFKESGRYLNDVYVYVEADPGKTTGTLRYGIKNPSYVPGAWLAYSTITLTRFGRQEYVFEGTSTSAPTDWNTEENWNKDAVPNQYHIVTIAADVNISESVEVYGISVDKGKTINIASTGGLTVGQGGVTNANDGSISIDNNPIGAGYFRIDPATDNKLTSKVKVNYSTRAYDSGSVNNEIWQYMGAPGKNMEANMAGATIYYWNETTGWQRHSGTMTPFAGYAFTQNKNTEAKYEVNVTPIFDDQQIDFTCTTSGSGMRGDNLFVNSYLAPIDITKIDEEDVVDDNDQLTKTFFIYNSGSWNQWKEGASDITAAGYDQSSAGHYYSIPFYSAKYLDPEDSQVVIPSMQGVYVYSQGAASLKLNYNKHVYKAETKNKLTHPMRAPQRETDAAFRRVCIQVVSENSGADRMYVIQRSNTTSGYDNGYDGDNIIAKGQANIYTTEHFGKMEVSCSNDIDSMYIGFTAGEDSEYMLNINAVVGEDLYLYDLENNSSFQLLDGEQYMFYAAPNSVNDKRFMLVVVRDGADEEQGGVTTEVDNVNMQQELWINDKMVYINHTPLNSQLAIYTISGMCVVAPYSINHTPCTIDLSYLPTGVYVIRLNNQAYKFVCK